MGGAKAGPVRLSLNPNSASSSMALAESYLTGGLFRQTLGRIERLAWHPT